MITTRYGLTIKKIVGYNADLAVAQCIREEDDAVRNYSIADLRATDGAAEILKACLAAPALTEKELAS